jgi:DNA-binding NarL/FixJ family response regulator
MKDPAALTPYEQRIWELRQQGLTNPEIGKAMNQLPASIASRIKVIKEKLELQDALRLVG